MLLVIPNFYLFLQLTRDVFLRGGGKYELLPNLDDSAISKIYLKKYPYISGKGDAKKLCIRLAPR